MTTQHMAREIDDYGSVMGTYNLKFEGLQEGMIEEERRGGCDVSSN